MHVVKCDTLGVMGIESVGGQHAENETLGIVPLKVGHVTARCLAGRSASRERDVEVAKRDRTRLGPRRARDRDARLDLISRYTGTDVFKQNVVKFSFLPVAVVEDCPDVASPHLPARQSQRDRARHVVHDHVGEHHVAHHHPEGRLDLDAVQLRVSDDTIRGADPLDVLHCIGPDTDRGAVRTEDTVRDHNVATGSPRLDRLQRDTVVAAVDAAIRDENILAAVDVDAIAIGLDPTFNAESLDAHLLAVNRMDCKRCSVLNKYTLDPHVAAVPQADQHRTRVCLTIAERLALAVDCALTSDGYVLAAFGKEERLVEQLVDDLRVEVVLREIVDTQQHGSRGQMQLDVTP